MYIHSFSSLVKTSLHVYIQLQFLSENKSTCIYTAAVHSFSFLHNTSLYICFSFSLNTSLHVSTQLPFFLDTSLHVTTQLQFLLNTSLHVATQLQFLRMCLRNSQVWCRNVPLPMINLLVDLRACSCQNSTLAVRMCLIFMIFGTPYLLNG